MSGEFAKKLYSSKRWQETRRAYGASKGCGTIDIDGAEEV